MSVIKPIEPQDTDTRLACPECGSDDLATIEVVEGTCDSDFVITKDGERVDFGQGETDLDWDTSTTIGVTCNGCDWEERGAGYLDELVPFVDDDEDDEGDEL